MYFEIEKLQIFLSQFDILAVPVYQTFSVNYKIGFFLMALFAHLCISRKSFSSKLNVLY